MSGTPHFPASMYTEKRDFLIAYAIDQDQRACKTQAQKLISGFLINPPKRWQPSFQEKQKVWQYQMDICEYYRQIVYAHKLLGNTVNTPRYFKIKYPVQITDWDRDLK